MRHCYYISNLHAHMDYALSAHLSSFQLQLQEVGPTSLGNIFGTAWSTPSSTSRVLLLEKMAKNSWGDGLSLLRKRLSRPPMAGMMQETAAPGLYVEYIVWQFTRIDASILLPAFMFVPKVRALTLPHRCWTRTLPDTSTWSAKFRHGRCTIHTPSPEAWMTRSGIATLMIYWKHCARPLHRHSSEPCSWRKLRSAT